MFSCDKWWKVVFGEGWKVGKAGNGGVIADERKISASACSSPMVQVVSRLPRARRRVGSVPDSPGHLAVFVLLPDRAFWASKVVARCYWTTKNITDALIMRLWKCQRAGQVNIYILYIIMLCIVASRKKDIFQVTTESVSWRFRTS